MNKQFLVLSAIFVGITLSFESCTHDPIIPEQFTSETPYNSGTCSPDTIYFERDVLPIFLSNCATSGCHDPSTAAEGVILNNYSNVINTGGVRAGRPNDSELYEVLNERGEDQMPALPASPLPPEVIAVIEKWINQGALNLTCNDSTCDSTNVSYANGISPVLTTNCVSCHSGSAPQGGISLTNYQEVKAQVDNGRLLGSVEQNAGFVAMPQGGKLSDCNIAMFSNWIADGAPNN